MTLNWWIAALPKRGNAAEEYEDASCTTEHAGNGVFLAAVADGATETSFSGEWARLLTCSWCEGKLRGRYGARYVEQLRATWRETVGQRPLPWYAEEKLRAGAFSTLLGLRIPLQDEEKTWQGLVIGDSCLFRVRDDRLITAYPIKRSADFDNKPALLSTSGGSAGEWHNLVRRVRGQYRTGDRFYLLTDAIATWFLHETEMGGRPWADLEDCADEPERFARSIDGLRDERQLRNDDVTVVAIHL